jgi:F420-non-reducing hydrogenase iron-sulfur subunit
VIACKWHPLTAMENATTDGFSFGPDVAIEPVKCSGVVTVAFILKLFAGGVEGVLVLGCAAGDCHYHNGGERCKAIVDETREILQISGIPGERLGFYQVADSTSKEFEKALTGFLKQFRKARGGRQRVAAQGGR